LIEEMALNNYQWSSERDQPKRVGGKYAIDALTLLTAKMDAMTQKLDKLNVNAVNSFASPHVKHAAYVNNFQPRLNHDPYSNSYDPGWKQHPNFSYRTDPVPFPQANARPTPPGFQRPTFPSQAPPPQKSNLESSALLAQ